MVEITTGHPMNTNTSVRTVMGNTHKIGHPYDPSDRPVLLSVNIVEVVSLRARALGTSRRVSALRESLGATARTSTTSFVTRGTIGGDLYS